MLGPRKPRRLDEPIVVSLEALVSVDHFYRHLEAKLDLSFVREWTWESGPSPLAGLRPPHIVLRARRVHLRS
jgi:hypothetical protein